MHGKNPTPHRLNHEKKKRREMSKATFNVSAFNRFLERGPVKEFLVRKAEEIAQEARANAPHATGELANSITVSRTDKGARIDVNAGHAGYVHQGTGVFHQPAPRNRYWPRLSNSLRSWAEHKDLSPRAVQRGIGQRGGTPAQPFLADAVEKVLGRLRFRWISKELNV